MEVGAVAGDVILSSERLETACLGARVPFALSGVCLTVAPQVLRIRESAGALRTSVSSILGRVVDSFVVSTTLSADIHPRGSYDCGNAHLTPDLLAKLLPQDEHT